MAIRKINGRYYCYYRDAGGKLRTLAIGAADESEAVLFDKMIKLNLSAHRVKKRLLSCCSSAFSEVVKETDALSGVSKENKIAHKRGTLALSAMFETAKTKRHLSKYHERAWKYFCRGVDVRFADEVTPAICQAYLDQRFGGKSAKTWNNNKSALNMVFRLCLVEANMTMSPLQPLMNKALDDVKSHRNLTDSEVDLILKNGDLQIRVMTMLGRWTAQRLETCARMTWNDFDFEQKTFLIKPGKTSRYNKFVCVPLFAPLERFLMELEPLIKDKSAPIVNITDWKYNDAFSAKFVRLLRRLNINDTADGRATFHSLRGSAITWMIDVGLSADIRRAITGHSNLSTEDIYARSIKGVSEAARKINKSM